MFKKSTSPANGIIELDDAKKMINAYHKHPDKLTIENENGEEVTLCGLVIDENTLKLLKESDATEYMILFAVRKSDVNEESNDKQFFTTILAPVKDSSIKRHELKNMFEPCPSECRNYHSVFPDQS